MIKMSVQQNGSDFFLNHSRLLSLALVCSRFINFHLVCFSGCTGITDAKTAALICDDSFILFTGFIQAKVNMGRVFGSKQGSKAIILRLIGEIC